MFEHYKPTFILVFQLYAKAVLPVFLLSVSVFNMILSGFSAILFQDICGVFLRWSSDISGVLGCLNCYLETLH